MHPVLRHVLNPFLVTVLGAMVLVDLLAFPGVPWLHWLPWTLVAVGVAVLWWVRRGRASALEASISTLVLAGLLVALLMSVYPSLEARDQAWCVAVGLFAAGVGSYSLAVNLPVAVAWLVVVSAPLVVLANDRMVVLGGAVVVWFVACLLRHRSLKVFSVEWAANLSRDPVTHLEHTRSFEAKVAAELARPATESAHLGVLSVDRLKELNQAFGHCYGDRLLLAVAERLLGLLDTADSATRANGSEIIVLLVGPPSRVSLLVRQLQGAYSIDGNRTMVGISSGWAEKPRLADQRVWINQARMALASHSGENRSTFFDPSLEQRRHLRQRYLDHLERALVDHEFFLVYQPQFDAASQTIVGAEALVRWSHPEDGPIPPSAFIPLAEETGLIADLGAWVLDQALKTARQWPPAWRLAVNVSANQLLDPTFPRRVWSSLTRNDFDPGRLTLEITESVLINDGGKVRQVLEAFRAGGIRISLDDFGTGYSSLLYLRNFPLDEIKVDQAFVRSIEGHHESMTIVATVLQLATSLGMVAVAEGIENATQATILKRFGCGTLQGYYFSRPVDDLEDFDPRRFA